MFGGYVHKVQVHKYLKISKKKIYKFKNFYLI